MSHPAISRKQFLKYFAFGLPAFLLPSESKTKGLLQKSPPLDSALVHEFVLKAHSSLETVQSMYEEEPRLLHAAWDWGSGDFETALGAASHVGHRELAEFLLSKGARMNLFTAAMLGNLSLVKAIIGQFPRQLYTHGPHQLSLMHHAKKGGAAAQDVVEWLEEQGIKK